MRNSQRALDDFHLCSLFLGFFVKHILEWPAMRRLRQCSDVSFRDYTIVSESPTAPTEEVLVVCGARFSTFCGSSHLCIFLQGTLTKSRVVSCKTHRSMRTAYYKHSTSNLVGPIMHGLSYQLQLSPHDIGRLCDILGRLHKSTS